MTMASTQDFVPEKDWPSISVMVDGFGKQTLPASPGLIGTTLRVIEGQGDKVEYQFQDIEKVTASATRKGQVQSWTGSYKAIEARPGIFIIDMLRGADRAAENTTIVLDRNTGAVTTGLSRLIDANGRTRATTEFNHINIGDGPFMHERTAELVGKRIFYRYSDVETYEHIYLNLGTFTWHCLRGGEKGLADTDRCATWKVAEDLYIFFWTEKVMTIEAVLVIDLQQKRSIGRMFGWDSSRQETLSLPFNSRLTLMNTTVYPEDVTKG